MNKQRNPESNLKLGSRSSIKSPGGASGGGAPGQLEDTVVQMKSIHEYGHLPGDKPAAQKEDIYKLQQSELHPPNNPKLDGPPSYSLNHSARKNPNEFSFAKSRDSKNELQYQDGNDTMQKLVAPDSYKQTAKKGSGGSFVNSVAVPNGKNQQTKLPQLVHQINEQFSSVGFGELQPQISSQRQQNVSVSGSISSTHTAVQNSVRNLPHNGNKRTRNLGAVGYNP